MKPTPRADALQINEDLDFEQRQWQVQRVAWWLLALLLLAGLLGLFGSGPLSHATASTDALTVEYDRVARERAPTELQVQFGPEAVREGEVTLWLDRAYLQSISIERLVPEPVESVAAAERVHFRFLVASEQPASEITFAIEPREPGLLTGSLGVVNGPQVTFQQFIFP